MTKKDYELIANVLLNAKRFKEEGEDSIETIAYMFCEVLTGDNVRFDSKRFLAACGQN